MSAKKLFDGANAVLGKPWVFFSVVLAVGLALTLTRAFSDFTSPFDEHTHLSYVQYAYEWKIPAQGYQMLSWAKDAFSCHPHSIYGAMTSVPCGTVDIGAKYPTGGTNTSQNWPPTYFFIVAVLMRAPDLFVADPLYSARIITAILWTLGAAWIGLQIFQLTKQKVLGAVVAITLVALPTFYFFTSSVSPHSLNPLLFAFAFFLSNKLIAQVKLLPSRERNLSMGRALREAAKIKWLYVFLALGPLFALTIPQSLTIIGVSFLYVAFTVLFSPAKSSWRARLTFLSLLALITALSTFVFTRLVTWWAWLSEFRRIPFPPGVNPGGANTDPTDPTYSSLITRVIQQWWSFWPNGIIPGFPTGQDVTAAVTPWLILLIGFSLAALIFWRRDDWLSPLMLAVFVSSPLFAIAYDFYFSTAVPIRYGIGIAIVGITSLGNSRMSKPAKYGIFLVVALTYVGAFFLDQSFVGVPTCHLDDLTHLIKCR